MDSYNIATIMFFTDAILKLLCTTRLVKQFKPIIFAYFLYSALKIYPSVDKAMLILVVNRISTSILNEFVSMNQVTHSHIDKCRLNTLLL